MIENAIYDKLISLICKNKNLHLDEALCTYPIDKLSVFFDNLETKFDITVEYDDQKDYMKKYFIVTENKYDDIQLFIYKNNYEEINPEELQLINKQFERIGYFYSFKTIRYIDNSNYDTVRVITYNYSPYTQNELIKKQKILTPYLYHMCPSYVLNKILKFGLIPKSKNSEFNYNKRVFLYCANQNKGDLIYLKNYLDNNNKNKLNNHEYYLLTIDSNLLPNNIQFFRDLDSKMAVYTYDCIPANCIINYEKI